MGKKVVVGRKLGAGKNLKVGRKAPAFALKNKEGNVYRLKDTQSAFTVVYFYPRDNTPGCTLEAQMFTKELRNFNHLDTMIIGISGGDEKSKTKFFEKNKLKILLLTDPDFAVCTKYGVYGEKSFMGRKFMGIHRVTFVLDKNDIVIKVYDKVKPFEHAKEILAFIKEQKH